MQRVNKDGVHGNAEKMRDQATGKRTLLFPPSIAHPNKCNPATNKPRPESRTEELGRQSSSMARSFAIGKCGIKRLQRHTWQSGKSQGFQKHILATHRFAVPGNHVTGDALAPDDSTNIHLTLAVLSRLTALHTTASHERQRTRTTTMARRAFLAHLDVSARGWFRRYRGSRSEECVLLVIINSV